MSAPRLTDKQEEFLWHLIEFPEEGDGPPWTNWTTIPEIADNNREQVKRGSWLPCVAWAASDVYAVFRRLKERGLVESRQTGDRGQWRPRTEWRMTPAGIETFLAKMDQRRIEEEASA